MKKKFFYLWSFIFLTWMALLPACNMPGVKTMGTQTANATQAYLTVEALLTRDAALTPSQTSLPSTTAGTPTPTTPTPTVATQAPTRTQPSSLSTPAKLCDQAAPGVPIDVTIPDDTKMQPAQTFTKVWRLQNTGTCTWTKNYSLAIFSGEPLGAPSSVPMPIAVQPGQSVDISVDMVAPQTAGTYQSNWKLRNASNTWFGIGPDGSSPFWVRIVVTSSTGTQTIVASASVPAPSSTPTPGILVSGNTPLIPSDLLNLDTNQVNAGGEDLAYAVNQDAKPLLTPLGGALIGVFGQGTPSLTDCQATPLGALPLLLENLPQGLYICYRTDQGNPGWARLLDFDPDDLTLSLQVLTWSSP